jgi:hypothetical protein
MMIKLKIVQIDKICMNGSVHTRMMKMETTENIKEMNMNMKLKVKKRIISHSS